MDKQNNLQQNNLQQNNLQQNNLQQNNLQQTDKIRVLITGGNGNIATIIKKNLFHKYNITSLGRSELNIISYDDLKIFFDQPENNFDILVHTAILGGRRTKEETGDITHINLMMLENLLKFADKFKIILNLDSAAIYDRSSDILNRKENELNTIPHDYYGFSKYLIYQRSLAYNHMYNFRLFNIFYSGEEPDRFIKLCFNAKYDNEKKIDIFENKYFDFMHEDDFIKIVEYYWSNINNQQILQKTINMSYEQKYKLSDIAKLILGNNSSQIIVQKENSNNNYSGDGSIIKSFDIKLDGLQLSLEKYEIRYHNQY